jgi:hypothetical protein
MWTVRLEDERGKEIKSLKGPFICGYLENQSVNESPFKILKYLDPYGDTTFNILQMDDVISDFELLQKMEECDGSFIQQIIVLAQECKAENHQYLVFVGD